MIPPSALERELIPHEAELQPALADIWIILLEGIAAHFKPIGFGQADLPWIKVGAELNAPKQSAAYAIAYICMPRAAESFVRPSKTNRQSKFG